MTKKRKPTITVKPVAWNSDTGQPLKYQAAAALGGVRIFSDPQPSPDKAMQDLFKACEAYLKLLASLAEYATDKEGYAATFRQMEEATKTDIIR